MWEKIQHRFDSPDAIISVILGFGAIVILSVALINATRSSINQKKATQESTMSNNLPVTYTVSEGDSLWTIARNHYKSGYNWVTIQKANSLVNPDTIVIGQTLILPPADPIEVGQITATSTERVIPKHSSYTVERGDTLWSIALSEYGNPYVYPGIAKGNNLPNPDILEVGMVLRLMPQDSDPTLVLPVTPNTI